MKKNDSIFWLEDNFSLRPIDDIARESSNPKEIMDYPVVYLLYKKSKRGNIYIGETSSAISRLKTHLKDEEKKSFEQFSIIFDPSFHKSATYNIETNLIQYITADNNDFQTTNTTQHKMKRTHNYYQKEIYDREIFGTIWDELRKRGFANQTIEEIRNTDIYKLSPFTVLNDEQLDVKEQIINFCENNIDNENGAVLIVQGDAGTGKSVLLSSVFKSIQDSAKDPSSKLHIAQNNHLLVNHEEMFKTYKNIAKKVSNLAVKNFNKPTSFINSIDKERLSNPEAIADIVLVDEAHLLLSTSDNYNNFSQTNHLEEIMKRSKITIIIFDDRQVLKAKSYWDTKSLETIVNNKPIEWVQLSQQMRMQANKETQDWIDNIVNKKISSIPKDENYEIKIFETAQEMYEAIKQKDRQNGISRMISTFDYLHKKDGKDYYIEEDEMNLPWNRIYNKNTWAEVKESKDEVGSIYTIQGFDLNYAGVILGPSITYNKITDRIEVDTSKYQDTEAFKGSATIYDGNGNLIPQEKVKEEIILNSLNVLLKRGVNGLYIYASDKDLNEKLRTL